MASFQRRVRLSVVFLQVALLLSACNGIPHAGVQEPGPPPYVPAGSLWTNTFPPLQHPGATLRFAHYGLEAGLSQSTVQAILQDNQGFLWIGTQDGLNRFDGYSFKVFRSDPRNPASLSSGEVMSLAQGNDGALWIATNAGLNRYDPVSGRFRQWTHNDADPASLADDQVNVVYVDQQGALWVGTENGLDEFDSASGEFKHVALSLTRSGSGSADSIRAIDEDGNHVLWIGTSEGLVRLDRAGGRLERYQNQGGVGTSLSFNAVTSIAEDHGGDLWVGTQAGLNRLDPSTGRFQQFLHSDTEPGSLADNYVQTTYLDRAGQLWIGTRNGVDRLDPQSQQFIHCRSDSADPASLSSNTIDSIYEDRGGVLWVGTADAGLDAHDRSQDQFAYYHHSNVDSQSLSSNVIFPILPAPQGKMWIGTSDAGLDLFDPATGYAEHFRHDPSDPNSLINDTVISLFVDRGGTLWAGTHRGLDRLFPASTKFTHFINDPAQPNSIPFGPVYAIFQDSHSTYWVGTGHGLRVFNPATGEFTRLAAPGKGGAGLSDGPVMAITQDRDGVLWFGTDAHGLFRYNPATGQLAQYANDPKRPDSLSSDAVLDIYQDRGGAIWIATFGGGLDRYVPQQDGFLVYRQEQGLPNDVVYGVLEDQKGDLWLSTNLGLSRFDPSTGKFDNFTVNNGLQSNEFDSSAFASDGNGRLYFGGIEGLTVFDPSNIQTNPYVPPLVLTSLTTQDGKAPSSKQTSETLQTASLSYPQNSFDFNFAALSFSRAGENHYKYMLDGFDRTWHDVGSDHRGTYTNLPGGTYTLRILGSNSDGVWNEAGVSIRVTVIPPFWQTWAFRILAGVLVIAAVLGIYRSRVRNIEAQKAALEQVVLDRTEALQKRNLDLEALYSADEKMLVLTQEGVMQALVEVAVDTLEADRSAIFTPLPGSGRFCVRVSRGFRHETVESAVFSDSQQEILSGVASGGPVVLSDAVQDPKWLPSGEALTKLMAGEGFRSIMYMPIKVQSEVVGVFGIYCCTSPDTFNERRQRLFSSLVQRAALSIENSRLFEETKRLAILEERSRLAQDLHDSAKQKAFAALAQLGAAQQLADRDHDGVAEHVAEAENIVSEVIRDLTFFIQEFYPGDLKQKGLAAALRSYAFGWERQSGIRLSLTVAGKQRLPPHMEQALYRVVQEGLANIARHSQADRASVRLAVGPRDIGIEIRDNGRGFDPQTAAHGLGLQSIQKRVESIGGGLRIDSSPGSGTCLTIRVPVSGIGSEHGRTD